MIARLFALAALVLPAPALAQSIASHCIALVENEFERIEFASFGDGLSNEEVRISYIDHSMFLIETPSGRGIITDFNGYAGIGVLPDVVTMNNAHSSHWTPNPNPEIPYILNGWGDGTAAADHRVELDGELLIRNVTTDIRSSFTGQQRDGNSIFIFEVAGLCIGHLGHLHHEPSEQQYAAIGRLDVVMAAVDGGMTVDLATMTRIIERLRSSIVLPMHWFGRSTLQAFVGGMSEDFAVEVMDSSSMVVSLRELPRRPTIRILQPRYLDRLD
ncbi:MBL fold metallo-hydrolase [Oceanibium sediminis]|uniref:MBL fold metallo-hydrolase n=1 Tax=Oceanibium sediminis TaxID=2026339 RepID=UPI000DD4545E|nr:MBL fold metallo-hydrolase [Oceanibium sediminis]